MPVVRIITLPFTFSWQWLTSLPKLLTIPALVISLLAGLYLLWFVLERPIAFAYAGDNCVQSLTFWPAGQRSVASSPFEISHKQPLEVLGKTLATRQTCVSMREAVKPGIYTTQISPFGNWLAAIAFRVEVPKPPVVSVAALSKPIPLTKPVVLGLSSKDETFTYSLQANDRESVCDQSTRALECELDELALEQGKTYEFAIARYFNKKPIETVAEKQAEILKATTVIETSIKPDEVVLAKPTEIVVKFDKSIVTAKATLARLGGEKPEPIESKLELGERELKLTFGELPREAEFEVAIDELEAEDGSSLVESYKLRFKTSGGPRVSGVSIPRAGVALGASAVISFDQELLVEQDVVGIIARSSRHPVWVNLGNHYQLPSDW